MPYFGYTPRMRLSASHCVSRVLDCGVLSVDNYHIATQPDLYDETVFENPEIVSGERLALHAERPRLITQLVEGQRAVVTRRAVIVRKTIDVDVLHEELQVTYVSGSGSEMEATEPESIIVRLHAEEIEIVKHVRVVEEVILGKRRVVQTLPISVAVRHEELSVVDSSNAQ